MFIKTLKYDFIFSKNVFFSMAAILIVLATILRMTIIRLSQPGNDSGGMMGSMIIMVTFLIVVTISIIQIAQFYYKNFFDDTGYLMLTLPAKRLPLLASKIVVSLVWFNFMLLGAAIAVIILDSQQMQFVFGGITRTLSLQNLIAIIEINLVAMFFILALFFVITLAHSSLWRQRIHGSAAAVVGVLYAGLCLRIVHVLTQRHREWVVEERTFQTPRFNHLGEYIGTYTSYGTASFYRSDIGVNIGRIPIGDMGHYFDIYQFAVTLVFCVITAYVTYYLLKRRICLR